METSVLNSHLVCRSLLVSGYLIRVTRLDPRLFFCKEPGSKPLGLWYTTILSLKIPSHFRDTEVRRGKTYSPNNTNKIGKKWHIWFIRPRHKLKSEIKYLDTQFSSTCVPWSRHSLDNVLYINTYKYYGLSIFWQNSFPVTSNVNPSS